MESDIYMLSLQLLLDIRERPSTIIAICYVGETGIQENGYGGKMLENPPQIRYRGGS